MAARVATRNLSSTDLGLPPDVNFQRIGIYQHLTPKLQELLYRANTVKTQNGYKFCWAKNSAVFLRKNDDIETHKSNDDG